jgi:hypothetical protein
MLKPLTMSLGLAAALLLCGVSKAQGLFHHDVVPSAQCPAPCPSAQECVQPCKPKCHLFEGLGHKMSCGFDNLSCGIKDMGCGFKDLCGKLKPKPKCYTYEWVLKKKRVWGCHGNCGSPACDTCAVYPSGQGAPSPQVAPSGQMGYAAPTYGSGQLTAAPAPIGTIATARGDEAPPAPEVGARIPTAPPAPPVPGATSGLLFSTPSGN